MRLILTQLPLEGPLSSSLLKSESLLFSLAEAAHLPLESLLKRVPFHSHEHCERMRELSNTDNPKHTLELDFISLHIHGYEQEQSNLLQN